MPRPLPQHPPLQRIPIPCHRRVLLCIPPPPSVHPAPLASPPPPPSSPARPVCPMPRRLEQHPVREVEPRPSAGSGRYHVIRIESSGLGKWGSGNGARKDHDELGARAWTGSETRQG